MSISRSGGPETHMVRIQMTEEFVQSADWMNGIARELGLQGRGVIEGRIIFMMLNVRPLEIEQLIERLMTTIQKSERVALVDRERLPFIHLSGFRMLRESSAFTSRDRHLTDGDNMCADCRAELKDPNNRRFGYPFTECPICAPAFQAIAPRASSKKTNKLACSSCIKEASDPTSRRYQFDEISCPECGPALFWQRRGETRWQQPVRETLLHATNLIREGGILAVKGNGGYHLLCDASNERAIRDLRRRKGNLLKPLTVMYSGISEVSTEMDINEQLGAALLSSTGSIVICPMKNPDEGSRIARTSLAGIYDRLGVMLPHTPLMQIISSFIETPLVVTSANRSGQPIIYHSELRAKLWEFADAIIDHDRRIPEGREEAIIQFTDAGERILLRSHHSRSTGLSVDWHDPSMSHGTAIAMSGEPLLGYLQDGIFKRIFVPEESQVGQYENIQRTHTEDHFDLSVNRPEICILERLGKLPTAPAPAFKSLWKDLACTYTWHHEAHFASVLCEHGLLQSDELILGVVWDRGGYGADGHEWGSEFLLRKQGRTNHMAAFDYIPNAGVDLNGPGHRIAALSLLRHRLDARRLIGHLFKQEEWPKYERRSKPAAERRTRSMSIFMDGVAAILGLTPEGGEGIEIDGLPFIESIARRIHMDVSMPYELRIRDGKVDWRPMIDTMIGDMDSGAGREMIARRFLASLAALIADACSMSGAKKVALSGDVFTSPLLVSMISEHLGQDVSLYIHQYLAPTDECVSLGQLAIWADARQRSRAAGSDTRASVRGTTGRSE